MTEMMEGTVSKQMTEDKSMLKVYVQPNNEKYENESVGARVRINGQMRLSAGERF